MRRSLPDAASFVTTLEATTPDLERYLRYIPIFGAPIANLLLSFRIRPVVIAVEEELLGRKPIKHSEWGDDHDKALFAKSICELAMLEMGWPNDRFLPTDPAAIVFWNHRDSLDFSATIKDLEDNLGVPIDAADINRWFERSFGEVVDDLWEKQKP